MTAIIIERDAAARGALEEALRECGHEVCFCRSASEARASLAGTSFGLALVDVDEPGDVGLSVCQWLRRERPGTWIVALIGEPGRVAALPEAGAHDVILKPVDVPAARVRIALAEFQSQQLRARQEEEQKHRYRTSTRAQQQAAVAALGQCAVLNVEVAMVLEQAISFVKQTLEVECCGIFERMAGENELLLQYGLGWADPCVRSARVSADANTAEGKALRHEPVIVPDWLQERELRMSPLHRAHQIRSSLVIVIPGAQFPYGVLAVHATRPAAFSEDDVHFVQAVAIVLSQAIERRRSEEAIQRLAAFAQYNPNPILELNAQAQLAYANEAASKMTQSLGRDSVFAMLPAGYTELVQRCLATGESCRGQQVELARRTLAWSFFPIAARQTVHCYGEEITTRVELETQFRQLQKMECIGQLAAGLAHDFNNVLTIIRGHADMLLMDRALAPKKVLSLHKIAAAVERAANLTRQLLTFSRKQVAHPAPLDLNACVGNMVTMLDRVLGEDIALAFEPSRDMPAVLGDAGLLDQVVLNLAVNARDAMPKGGRLILTTSLVAVDEAYVQRHSQARLGRFGCLSVTDTGCGMDAATLSHIFEPFFTTKEVGRGTGLGLATAYGIVQQHQCWIEVTSQVGQGTTFLIFLPCSDSAAQPPTPDQSLPPKGGSETILVVEDEPTLRELARMILQNYGYRVLEAGSGVEALAVWARERTTIDLLLTDLVMPEGLSGVELGRRLMAQKATLKILYASGYSSELMSKEAVPQEICFLQKPYPAETLARLVREQLDGRPA